MSHAATSLAVRAQLIEALQLDLVGPTADHPLAAETLPQELRPSLWYLTGFLIPLGTPPEVASDLDEDEEVEAVSTHVGMEHEQQDDRRAAKRGFFPSSLGLTFLVAQDVTELQVLFRWGDYRLVPLAATPELLVWERTQHELPVTVTLTGAPQPAQPLPATGGLHYQVVERVLTSAGRPLPLPAGTRSVSLFLVNHRPHDAEWPDRAYAFQAELEVRCTTPFVARPNLRDLAAEDWDDLVADLHYAWLPEYAVGHNVAADWTLAADGCYTLRTTWLPSAEVEQTVTTAVAGVELRMDVLAALPDGAAAEAALQPLVTGYRDWIAACGAAAAPITEQRCTTAQTLRQRAKIAADRIAQGIALLQRSPAALEAFRTANRAVARALRVRNKLAAPTWRAFQLAFILLNLPALSDPHHAEREHVDLLFFPTGGGKTEAYLGLAAFVLLLRRLNAPADGGKAGAGVSVVMRYTLRLLTLDQLARAAGMVCALELERSAAPERYGTWPFEIGLWVGKGATPNELGRKGDKRHDTARTIVTRFKNDAQANPSPIPLESCPWCNTPFTPASFSLQPNSDKPTELRIICSNFACDFSGQRPLPIVAVDESIYRRLPAFLIATVDKFAALPWIGPSGALLGGADRHDASGFYGAAEPQRGRPLSQPLAPPDLIIQDELHLISGPLGTLAGLYETAIDTLATRIIDGKTVRPKIIASTATVRRAQQHIQALFGRTQTHIFPPPGPERGDSFFAQTAPSSALAARHYLGIAAQGRSPKVVMRRAWLALMGAAQRAYEAAGGDGNQANPADPYMTVLGYFNNLRELGGARRILEEEVQNTIKSYGARRRSGEASGLFADRLRFSEVLELTSRVSTDQVADARRRLASPFHQIDHRVDCALATNMISVGLDIQRLGLMLVIGQPMLTAEYIQATSRVGRDANRPGLVVTLLNAHKPRDRSHYERFRHYHETFYRSVEASSVTPFAARALDRGLAGAMVALARHSQAQLSPSAGAGQLAQVRATLEQSLISSFQARAEQQDYASDERDERLRALRDYLINLLDAWQSIIAGYHQAGVALHYQPYETLNLGGAKPLLRDPLERQFETDAHRKFRASRSLRDVEPEVNLYLRDLNNQLVEEG
ncbi:DISARM system helicase DrmA [Candidatus Viridilinea mediisalina]|uniref:Helicase n=1 Tax=Candidatus Viridilinea mediisalina TaxID=2024553 RepID=A0A2A6RE95_9CHLR|nr:DISARM system helicase DrmA [Candidatus Viridilinea mediisalina]PDW01326.1 helicase [Candidatus Viridilinea mediisalina]